MQARKLGASSSSLCSLFTPSWHESLSATVSALPHRDTPFIPVCPQVSVFFTFFNSMTPNDQLNIVTAAKGTWCTHTDRSTCVNNYPMTLKKLGLTWMLQSLMFSHNRRLRLYSNALLLFFFPRTCICLAVWRNLLICLSDIYFCRCRTLVSANDFQNWKLHCRYFRKKKKHFLLTYQNQFLKTF